MSDLQRGLDGLTKAAENYQTAGLYYHGNVPEFFVSNSLRQVFQKDSKAFYLNYSKVAVTSKLERIHVAAVTVQDDDIATSALQQLVWEYNDLILHQKRIHETALSLGDSYMIVWPEDDGVKVSFNSPLGCRVLYRADDPYTPEYAIKQWGVGGDEYRVNLYYPDRIEKYISVTGKNADDVQWAPYTEEDNEVWPLPNPFGEIPVFHFAANGAPYGYPVHGGTYGAQNAILKLNNLNLAVAEYQGFPQRYALADVSKADGGTGFDLDDFDTTIDTPTTPSTGRSRIKNGPGEMQNFENIKAVGTFEAASADGYLKGMDFYIDSMATTSSTPLHAFKAGSDAPSGEALRRAEAPLIKSVQDLTEEFTRPWSRALSFALACIGLPGRRVYVQWDAPQSVDDEDSWKVVQQKIDAGVPAAVALIEAGYSQTQVDAWGVSTTSAPASAVVEPAVDPIVTQ